LRDLCLRIFHAPYVFRKPSKNACRLAFWTFSSLP